MKFHNGRVSGIARCGPNGIWQTFKIECPTCNADFLFDVLDGEIGDPHQLYCETCLAEISPEDADYWEEVTNE